MPKAVSLKALVAILSVFSLLIIGGIWTVSQGFKFEVAGSGGEAQKKGLGFFSCGDQDGKADLYVRIRDSEVTGTTTYIAAPLVPVESEYPYKTLAGSIAGLTDGAYGNASNIVECGKKIRMITLNDASYPLIVSEERVVDEPIERFDLDGTDSLEAQFRVYTSAWANETNGQVQDTLSTNAQAMSQNSVLTMRFDVAPLSGTGQFGAYTPVLDEQTGEVASAYICGFADNSVMTANDLTLSFNRVEKESTTLPKVCAANAISNSRTALRSWVAKPVKSSDGTPDGSITLGASSGNPGANADPRFTWVDVHSYRGQDQLVHYGTANDAGTDIGETNRYFEINVS